MQFARIQFTVILSESCCPNYLILIIPLFIFVTGNHASNINGTQGAEVELISMGIMVYFK